jgi:hypothetical protein
VVQLNCRYDDLAVEEIERASNYAKVAWVEVQAKFLKRLVKNIKAGGKLWVKNRESAGTSLAGINTIIPGLS